jgi:hypothetical protein
MCSAGLMYAKAVGGEEPTTSQLSSPYIVVFRVSDRALQSQAGGPVASDMPVNEIILGTRVTGTARVTGQSDVQPIEDCDHGKFLITLRGTADGTSVGINGPAVIHSRSRTSFVATKRAIFVPGEGFFTQPAKVTANTAIQNTGIDSTRGGIAGRVVRRVASEEVANNRERTRQIAEQIALKKIEAAFESAVAQRLAGLNRQVEQRTQVVRSVQLGRNVRMNAATTPQGVLVGIRPADTVYAPIELPALDPNSPGELWVHQSLLEPEVAGLFAELRQALVRNRQFFVSTLDTAEPGSEGKLVQTLRPAGGLRSSRVEDWIVLQPARQGNSGPSPAIVAQSQATGNRVQR